MAGNGSGFTAGNPNAPQGSQVAFLQAAGTISQVVNFATAGSYLIGVSATQRGNKGTSNEEVKVPVRSGSSRCIAIFKMTAIG